MKVLYRVSSDLRQATYKDGCFTVIKQEKEQCGCFYYFRKLENACKATIEFGTGIDVLPYDSETRTQDDWYE